MARTGIKWRRALARRAGTLIPVRGRKLERSSSRRVNWLRIIEVTASLVAAGSTLGLLAVAYFGLKNAPEEIAEAYAKLALKEEEVSKLREEISDLEIARSNLIAGNEQLELDKQASESKIARLDVEASRLKRLADVMQANAVLYSIYRPGLSISEERVFGVGFQLAVLPALCGGEQIDLLEEFLASDEYQRMRREWLVGERYAATIQFNIEEALQRSMWLNCVYPFLTNLIPKYDSEAVISEYMDRLIAAGKEEVTARNFFTVNMKELRSLPLSHGANVLVMNRLDAISKEPLFDQPLNIKLDTKISRRENLKRESKRVGKLIGDLQKYFETELFYPEPPLVSEESSKD